MVRVGLPEPIACTLTAPWNLLDVPQDEGNVESYSITLSARAITVGGTVRPSFLETSTLMISSKAVGCCIGKSLGLAPLRILSTYVAARRWMSGTLGP